MIKPQATIHKAAERRRQEESTGVQYPGGVDDLRFDEGDDWLAYDPVVGRLRPAHEFVNRHVEGLRFGEPVPEQGMSPSMRALRRHILRVDYDSAAAADCYRHLAQEVMDLEPALQAIPKARWDNDIQWLADQVKANREAMRVYENRASKGLSAGAQYKAGAPKETRDGQLSERVGGDQC